MSAFKQGDRVINGYGNGTVVGLSGDTHVRVSWDLGEWDDGPQIELVHVDDLTLITN